MIENLYSSFINLDHRTDRLAHMERELKKTAILKPVRTRGLKPEEVHVSREIVAVMQARTPGAIGCHFSQVSVMKEALKQGKNACVLEDDIILCDDFDDRLNYIDKWTGDHDWDVVWLGASFHVNPPYWHPKGKSGMPPDCSAQLGYDCLPTEDARMIRTFGAYVTFAYIVNVKSIEKILDYLDWFLPQTIGIDFSFIAAAKYRPDFKFFSFVPGCIMQRDNISDIGNGMTMWSGQLKNGPYVFKNKMIDFDPNTYQWK